MQGGVLRFTMVFEGIVWRVEVAVPGGNALVAKPEGKWASVTVPTTRSVTSRPVNMPSAPKEQAFNRPANAAKEASEALRCR